MLDDAQCLARFAACRDAESFTVLVERHAGMVYGVCVRICQEPADAEDAVQEAFLALARDAGQIRTSVPAWLHGVALHAALRLRRRRRHPSLHAIPEPVAEDTSRAWREDIARIDAVLAELPEDLRTVLLLRHLEGRSQTDIAELLGLSQPTVSRRLAEGVRELRRRLRWARDEGMLVAALDAVRVPAPPSVIAQLGHLSLAGAAPATASLPPLLQALLALVVCAASLGLTALIVSPGRGGLATGRRRSARRRAVAAEAHSRPGRCRSGR